MFRAICTNQDFLISMLHDQTLKHDLYENESCF